MRSLHFLTVVLCRLVDSSVCCAAEGTWHSSHSSVISRKRFSNISCPSSLEMHIFASLSCFVNKSKTRSGSKLCQLTLVINILKPSRQKLDVGGDSANQLVWAVSGPAPRGTVRLHTVWNSVLLLDSGHWRSQEMGLLKPHAALHEAPSLIPYGILTWDHPLTHPVEEPVWYVMRPRCSYRSGIQIISNAMLFSSPVTSR